MHSGSLCYFAVALIDDNQNRIMIIRVSAYWALNLCTLSSQKDKRLVNSAGVVIHKLLRKRTQSFTGITILVWPKVAIAKTMGKSYSTDKPSELS